MWVSFWSGEVKWPHVDVYSVLSIYMYTCAPWFNNYVLQSSLIVNISHIAHPATLPEGALRLGSKSISSSGYVSGRVEIWHSGSWGTICNRAWSNNDGTVACQQMGYAGRDWRGLIHSFSGGSGPVHAQYLYCSTSYEWITQCFSSWGSTCSHSQDVGVYCESKSKLTFLNVCVSTSLWCLQPYVALQTMYDTEFQHDHLEDDIIYYT